MCGVKLSPKTLSRMEEDKPKPIAYYIGTDGTVIPKYEIPVSEWTGEPTPDEYEEELEELEKTEGVQAVERRINEDRIFGGRRQHNYDLDAQVALSKEILSTFDKRDKLPPLPIRPSVDESVSEEEIPEYVKELQKLHVPKTTKGDNQLPKATKDSLEGYDVVSSRIRIHLFRLGEILKTMDDRYEGDDDDVWVTDYVYSGHQLKHKQNYPHLKKTFNQFMSKIQKDMVTMDKLMYTKVSKKRKRTEDIDL